MQEQQEDPNEIETEEGSILLEQKRRLMARRKFLGQQDQMSGSSILQKLTQQKTE
jgi:hypothetical protein